MVQRRRSSGLVGGCSASSRRRRCFVDGVSVDRFRGGVEGRTGARTRHSLSCTQHRIARVRGRSGAERSGAKTNADGYVRKRFGIGLPSAFNRSSCGGTHPSIHPHPVVSPRMQATPQPAHSQRSAAQRGVPCSLGKRNRTAHPNQRSPKTDL
jgi:hypothetical protein